MSQENMEEIIYNETEKRLSIMEKPDYEFPKSVGKADYIGIMAGIGVSLILIILCVTGVIV